jgi:two-component system, cell cycle response regulator CtrA
VDVDARLEAVEAENDMLRAKVEQLEGLIGMRTTVPISFGLTGQEARVLGILMKRDMASKELVMAGLYSHRADDNVEIKIVGVFVCKIRKKLQRFDIPIETVRGQGYRLKPEIKDKVRGIMRDEGLVA